MTWQLDRKNTDEFRAVLEASGYSFEIRPHQVFLARGEGAVVNLYENGKVVIGGAEGRAIEAVEAFLQGLGAKELEKVVKSYPAIDVSGTRIGTDEAGKGDYFGPLVVAGVLATEFQAGRLREIGVKDSKLLSDSSIQNLSNGICQILVSGQYDVITISPARYNSLYRDRFHNVNGILGWAHARAIENLLGFREPCEVAIADQFGDQSYIRNALMKRGRAIRLIQIPKAERDVVVAAASVLARAGFIDKMREMSESFGATFPKGATHVVDFGKEFVARHGFGGLATVAKLHFATTGRLGFDEGSARPEVEPPSDPEALSPIHTERDQEVLRIECYSLISAFETELRRYIESKLRGAFGADWWERGIPAEVRGKAERRHLAETQQGKHVSLIECVDFDHYQLILTFRDSWDAVFAPDFRGKDQLIARLTLLKSTRNPVSHSRALEQRNKIEVIAAIEWMRTAMLRGVSQRRLDEFGHTGGTGNVDSPSDIT